MGEEDLQIPPSEEAAVPIATPLRAAGGIRTPSGISLAEHTQRWVTVALLFVMAVLMLRRKQE